MRERVMKPQFKERRWKPIMVKVRGEVRSAMTWTHFCTRYFSFDNGITYATNSRDAYDKAKGLYK